MIWLLTFGLCAAVFAYVATPLYFKRLPEEEMAGPQDSVISAYKLELQNIEKTLASGDGDVNALSAQKLVLEKRLIESATKTAHVSPTIKPIWAGATFAALFAGTFGIYAVIGSPKLSSPEALNLASTAAQQPPAISPEALVAERARDLQTGTPSARKWGLYARSLMNIGRYKDAFAAYEKALEISDNNPDIAAELQGARDYAAQQESAAQGASRADMDAAAQMSVADRAAMIQGMVDGLSERLAEDPDNAAGWIRLLRSRKVLSQTQEAEEEIAAMKSHFAENPEMITQILTQSGWDN